MRHLYDIIAELATAWRKGGYPCEAYPLIADLLYYQGDSDTGSLRFLRRPQFRALEAYCYLRLVEDTSCVLPLYRKYYSKKGAWSKRWEYRCRIRGGGF